MSRTAPIDLCAGNDRLDAALRQTYLPISGEENELLGRISENLRRRARPRRALRFDYGSVIGLIAAAGLSAGLLVADRQAFPELAIGLAITVMTSCMLWILVRSWLAGSFRLIHGDCRAAVILAIGCGATLNLLIR